MPKVKTKQKKQIKKTDAKKIDDSVSDIEKDVILPKLKKNGVVEIDEVEEVVVHEDKIPVDPLLETSEIDTELEEIGLDDEELDPFNDKWEQ